MADAADGDAWRDSFDAPSHFLLQKQEQIVGRRRNLGADATGVAAAKTAAAAGAGAAVVATNRLAVVAAAGDQRQSPMAYALT